jgi:tetratricopeptide (TPR) repeat protein
MNPLQDKITKITSVLTQFVLLLTPLFFLPITREFIIVSKLYFFIYAVIGLAVVSLINLIVTRKIVWQKDIMINGILMLLVGAALSIIIMTPNKMQALFIPHDGFLPMLALVIYYMFLVGTMRKSKDTIFFYIAVAGFIASLVGIFGFIAPLKSVKLPAEIAFLNAPLFNTVGTQLDFIMFNIFTVVAIAAYFLTNKDITVVNGHGHNHKIKNIPVKTLFYVFFAVALINLILQVFQVGKAILIDDQSFVLPPLSISWYAAIEILKNPLTTLFGVGVGNFSAMFTQVKTAAYNSTDLWQVASFNISRSAFLHIFTEMGLVGAAGLGIIIVNIFRNMKLAKAGAKVLIGFGLILLFFFPPSFMLFFIFFVCLAYFTANVRQHEELYEADLAKIVPVYVACIIVFLVFIGALTYFTSTSFASELIYKSSLDAAARNDLKGLYEAQRNAIIINPYNEDFRRSYSQTNLIIANNIASKKKEEITEKDKETITQAIQASIAEAKAAVALNPAKVTNWQYLATVYRNIIYVAQGSELWTIAAYQRAILLDPQNPTYRLELGGVYYLLQVYDEAQKLFEQAVTLKPDWANAHYNLAWTLDRKKDYAGAVAQMQTVLTLINPKTNKADYDQAKKDLDTFKKQLDEQQKADAANGAQNGQQQQQTQTQQNPTDERLNLPTPPAATFEPKLQLPQSASPGAGTSTVPPARN